MAPLHRSTRQLINLTKYPIPYRTTYIFSSSSLHPRRLYTTNPESSSNSQEKSQNPTLAQSVNSDVKSSDQSPSQTDLLTQKDSQIAEYKDLYLRARADYENLQKITIREKSNAKDYAIQSFAKDLVSNIDVLQLALDSVPVSLRTCNSSEGPTENEDRKHLADLWGGVFSTKNLLEKTLSRYGVTPFDPTGQQFDPNKHEAMYQTVVPGKEPNSVLNCSKMGWMLRDRVLRPAQVGVAQASESS
ncbi:hypothetical protein O181_116154 [Austropuccinia psidii MF-1]|uniref:GrpE protein homolog, mitochondrial n=1 Tax=Austropuccinia psidii MF-1 TaxID=1389203 RepID=A0A9Q3PW94_9BASI|nr:hypothetical protein [Austropuccinia psidii MF-1]